MPRLLVVAVAVCWAATACAHGGARHPAVARPTTSATTPSTPTGSPRFAVGVRTYDLVDTNRQRLLRTTVYFPAVGPPLHAGRQAAPGAFPLVLMAHGYRLPVSGYARILERVAAAGYLVAAPAFPHTGPSGDGSRADLVNQPADLTFVLDAVLRLAARPASPLPRVAHPGRVGALGHSDGGLTVSAWAYDNDYRDPRVACVVELAGGIALFQGTYFGLRSPPPLLAVHGSADLVDPYAASVHLVAAVPAGTPRYLVTVVGGSHLGPFLYDTALPQVGQVVVDFLDTYLGGDPGARARLLRDGSRPGLRIRAG